MALLPSFGFGSGLGTLGLYSGLDDWTTSPFDLGDYYDLDSDSLMLWMHQMRQAYLQGRIHQSELCQYMAWFSQVVGRGGRRSRRRGRGPCFWAGGGFGGFGGGFGGAIGGGFNMCGLSSLGSGWGGLLDSTSSYPGLLGGQQLLIANPHPYRRW